MNFAILRHYLAKKLTHVVFNEQDVHYFVSDIIKHLGIPDYLKGIESKSCGNGNLATYDFFSRILKINLANIIEEANKYYEADNQNLKIAFVNLFILLSIIHELVHAFQNYAINETDYDIYKLMKKEICFVQSMGDEEFNKHYTMFTYERDALVKSHEEILKIICDHVRNKQIFDFFRNCLIQFMLSGYTCKRLTVVSPLEHNFKHLFNEEVPSVATSNIYNTLQMGFPIKVVNYRRFKKYGKILVVRKNNLYKK